MATSLGSWRRPSADRLTAWFWSYGLQNSERRISVVLVTIFVVTCYGRNRKKIYPDICFLLLFYFLSPSLLFQLIDISWDHTHTRTPYPQILQTLMRSKCGLENSQHEKWFIVGLFFTKYFFSNWEIFPSYEMSNFLLLNHSHCLIRPLFFGRILAVSLDSTRYCGILRSKLRFCDLKHRIM